MESLHSEESLYQSLLAHSQVSLAGTLLVAIWLDLPRRRWQCQNVRLRSPFSETLPTSMPLVVCSGLLVVEDGTFGYAPMVQVQLFGLGSDRRQGDSLLVLAERIDALFHQVNGPLAKLCVDLLF